MRNAIGKLCLQALGACLLMASHAQAALPPGISGAWYNPAQSGHGLSVEIIAPDRALVFWYAYDLEGNPFNLYIDGRIQGRRIEATALAPRGMRFGSFDPTEMELPVWGSLSIDFEDCDTGKLSWQANDPAFGSGSTDLVRLTSIHAQTCDIGDPAEAVSDVYEAAIVTHNASGAAQTSFGIAAVDADGRLWGMQRLGVGQLLEQIPGPTSLLPPPRIITARLQDEAQESGATVVRETGNYWARFALASIGPVRGNWVEAGGAGTLSYSDAMNRPAIWELQSSPAALQKPLSVQRLARSRTLLLNAQLFGPNSVRVTLTADGSVCVTNDMTPTSACRFQGRYWLTDAEAGFFDFELRERETRVAPEIAYRGRGWLQVDGQGEALIMVGDDGHTGLGLIAR
ncbi:MAG: hypothetical protein ACT4NL_04355 [Pseudomarimonas sp.]